MRIPLSLTALAVFVLFATTRTTVGDISVTRPAATQPALARIDQSQYAGSQACAKCHQQYYDSWKETGHNKMIRAPKSDGPAPTVVADFNQTSPVRTFELKDVKWVIGYRWKQRFIGEVDGKEVVFPAQWSIKEKKWQPYAGKSDWWYPTHKDWKTRSNFKLCAGCHSTGSDAGAGTWVELNITCESCHGPGKLHSQTAKPEDIVNPARLSVARSMDVCLSCHQAGRPPGDEFAWPVGYQPGMDLSRFWKGFDPEAGKQSAEFWHNGTAHKNRVQGNTFLQSVMHDAGIQCSVCHDSHGSRHLSLNVKSAATNALCLTCHGPDKKAGPKYAVLSDHTHHGPLSAGSRCIECHMPKTGENSVGAEARNHTFDFISPAQTIKTGDPNSCNACHTDRTAQWALSAVEKWYPKAK